MDVYKKNTKKKKYNERDVYENGKRCIWERKKMYMTRERDVCENGKRCIWEDKDMYIRMEKYVYKNSKRCIWAHINIKNTKIIISSLI